MPSSSDCQRYVSTARIPLWTDLLIGKKIIGLPSRIVNFIVKYDRAGEKRHVIGIMTDVYEETVKGSLKLKGLGTLKAGGVKK